MTIEIDSYFFFGIGCFLIFFRLFSEKWLTNGGESTIIYIAYLICGCSLMVELQPSKLTTGVRFSSSAPFVKIVGTTDVEIKLNSKELSFFVFKKGCDYMLNIIKEKLDLSPDLKKKIDWAKKYTSTPIKLEKGHLIRLEPSNLAYVDPHKVIINDYTFLFFNGVDTFYINNLNDKHNLSELEKYFKLAKCS